MRYQEFEKTMSGPRMSRYLLACNQDSRKAMTLYRKNLKLSQELFTVISCFEIALRNKIDQHYLSMNGNEWLKHSVDVNGMFDNPRCRVTAQTIREELGKLSHRYTHPKLVAALGFGFWRYLFSTHQFRAGGQLLLQIFPGRPASTPKQQYNANFVFNQLKQINDIRNRIAHHEPICFKPGIPIKDTTYVRQHYSLILQLFQWMSIDEGALLYGLDHINTVCNEIDDL